MISRFATLIIACAMVCPAAIAQTSRPDSATKTQSNEAKSDAKGLLAGPEIRPSAEDQNQIRFDGSIDGRGGRGRIIVPRKRWFVLLRSLELSQEQDDEIRPILQSLQKANREHNVKHGKRIRQLQKQFLRANGPKAETYQKRIWEFLTTSQQEQMRKSLKNIRQDLIKLRESRNSDQKPASDKAMMETEQDKETDDMDEQSKRRLDFLKSQQAPSTSKGNPGR